MATPAYGAAPRKQGMAIASLVLGFLAIPTLGCLLVGAVVAIVLGVVALVRANRQPEAYGGAGFAIAGIALAALSLLVALPLGAIAAAIAIPSFLRARVSANEAAAIGDVRTVISAQMAYASTSGGPYGSMECLAAPAGCLPNYTGPTFLDSTFAATTVRSGYRRSFHPGPPAVGGNGASGYQSFAFVVAPETPGKTGVRHFCGDASGILCYTSGTRIDAGGGTCPVGAGCEPLH